MSFASLTGTSGLNELHGVQIETSTLNELGSNEMVQVEDNYKLPFWIDYSFKVPFHQSHLPLIHVIHHNCIRVVLGLKSLDKASPKDWIDRFVESREQIERNESTASLKALIRDVMSYMERYPHSIYPDFTFESRLLDEPENAAASRLLKSPLEIEKWLLKDNKFNHFHPRFFSGQIINPDQMNDAESVRFDICIANRVNIFYFMKAQKLTGRSVRIDLNLKWLWASNEGIESLVNQNIANSELMTLMTGSKDENQLSDQSTKKDSQSKKTAKHSLVEKVKSKESLEFLNRSVVKELMVLSLYEIRRVQEVYCFFSMASGQHKSKSVMERYEGYKDNDLSHYIIDFNHEKNRYLSDMMSKRLALAFYSSIESTNRLFTNYIFKHLFFLQTIQEGSSFAFRSIKSINIDNSKLNLHDIRKMHSLLMQFDQLIRSQTDWLIENSEQLVKSFNFLNKFETFFMCYQMGLGLDKSDFGRRFGQVKNLNQFKLELVDQTTFLFDKMKKDKNLKKEISEMMKEIFTPAGKRFHIITRLLRQDMSQIWRNVKFFLAPEIQSYSGTIKFFEKQLKEIKGFQRLIFASIRQTAIQESSDQQADEISMPEPEDIIQETLESNEDISSTSASDSFFEESNVDKWQRYQNSLGAIINRKISLKTTINKNRIENFQFHFDQLINSIERLQKKSTRIDLNREELFSEMVSIVITGCLMAEELVNSRRETTQACYQHFFKGFLSNSESFPQSAKLILSELEYGEIFSRGIGKDEFFDGKLNGKSRAERLLIEIHRWYLQTEKARPIEILLGLYSQFCANMIWVSLSVLNPAFKEPRPDIKHLFTLEQKTFGLREDFPEDYTELKQIIAHKVNHVTCWASSPTYCNIYNNLLPRLGTEMIRTSTIDPKEIALHYSTILLLSSTFIEEFLYGIVLEKKDYIDKKSINHDLFKLLNECEINLSIFSHDEITVLKTISDAMYFARYPHAESKKDYKTIMINAYTLSRVAKSGKKLSIAQQNLLGKIKIEISNRIALVFSLIKKINSYSSPEAE